MKEPHVYVKKKTVTLLFLLATGSVAMAQVTSFSSVGNAEATVLEQVLTMTSVSNLSFGSIFPISTNEVVTLAPNGTNLNNAPLVTKSNANVLIVDSPTAGVWDITGVPSALITVTLPTDGTVTLEDGAGHAMAVNSFNLRSSGAGSSLNLTLDGSGNVRFALFAALSIGANQAAGGYTGTYPLTINYQ